MVEGEHKACPYCGEQILAVAVRCKHCGSDIGAERVTAASAPADYGIVLLAIPAAAALLLWFWVGNMMLIHSPVAYAWLLMIVAIGGTAVLATIEDGKVRGSTDFKWLVSIALVWVIAYPAYLRKRAEHGLRDLMVPGICVAVALVGSAFIVQNAIAEAEMNNERAMAEVDASVEEMKAEASQFAATVEDSTEAASADAGSASAGDSEFTADVTAAEVASVAPVAPQVVAVATVLPAGKFSNARDVLLWIESRSDGSAAIRVVAGAAGADACVEGWVDCLSLTGIATPADAAYEFNDHDDDCTFRVRSEGADVVVSDVKGVCGTGTGNRHQLDAILAPFTPGEPVKPSFSCAQAGTAVEQAICGNPELSRLDSELAQAYGVARRGAADSAQIQAQQRAWIQSRNACITDACLLAAYQARLADLAGARERDQPR